MDRRLTLLFDMQKFQNKSKLNSIISDVENRYAHSIDDDDLELVSAAGTGDMLRDKPRLVTIILLPEERKP